MALGKRRREQQLEAFVAASGLPNSPGHPLCSDLNRMLVAGGSDEPVERYIPPKGKPTRRVKASHRQLVASRLETQKTTWATGC
jgi:hypothetical protein